MKRVSQRGMYNAVADINVVPLMDLVFNLLIVFMLCTPLLEQTIHIRLPTTQTGAPVNSKDITTINLDSAGRAFVEEKLAALPELEQIARSKILKDPQHAMLIRGDEKVPYGKFVEIVDCLKHAGVAKLGIVGTTAKKPTPEK